jgi:hypothetical protein
MARTFASSSFAHSSEKRTRELPINDPPIVFPTNTCSSKPWGSIAMKTHKREILIRQLEEGRYAVAVDGFVRYVGTQEECERRVAIFVPKDDRTAQDEALARVGRLMRRTILSHRAVWTFEKGRN